MDRATADGRIEFDQQVRWEGYLDSAEHRGIPRLAQRHPMNVRRIDLSSSFQFRGLVPDFRDVAWGNLSLRRDKLTAVAERMPSLELVLGAFEDERNKQLAHFDAIDGKAGVILGFSGVLLALNNGEGWVDIVGLVAGLAAAGAALRAFWPQALPALRPGALRRYLLAEKAFTQLTMTDTLLVMIEEGAEVLTAKSRRLKVALSALAISAALFAVGVSGVQS